MTHRLDLSPELEAKLQALAAQRGADADATALQVLEEHLREVPVAPPVEEESAAEALGREEVRRRQREAAVEGYGKMAGIGPSVDEFLREKHEETRRETEGERGATGGWLRTV